MNRCLYLAALAASDWRGGIAIGMRFRRRWIAHDLRTPGSIETGRFFTPKPLRFLVKLNTRLLISGSQVRACGAYHIQQASRRKDVLWIGEGERMVCNPSDLRSNSLKGVPTAQNCLLKSMGVFGCDLSEKPLKNLAKASDFQAEYEGSIPFTRSNFFKHFSRSQLFIRTRKLALIRTNVRRLFGRRDASWPRS